METTTEVAILPLKEWIVGIGTQLTLFDNALVDSFEAKKERQVRDEKSKVLAEVSKELSDSYIAVFNLSTFGTTHSILKSFEKLPAKSVVTSFEIGVDDDGGHIYGEEPDVELCILNSYNLFKFAGNIYQKLP